MPYTIKHANTQNHNDITVNDNSINSTATSLGFPGRNERGYGVVIAENFLHLLENFASSDQPANPIEGQLWYDTSNNTAKILKIYNGSIWKTTGIERGSSLVRNSTVGVKGDLYVDTDTQQVYIWTGTNWKSINPQYSSESKTGPQPDYIRDTNEHDQPVLYNYVDNTIVSIYSLGDTITPGKKLQPFKPKTDIPGFANRFIYPGINLRTDSINNTFKYYGIAEQAESLYNSSSKETIPANTFMRKDVPNTVNNTITIKTDSGLSVGNNGQLQLKVLSGIGVLYHGSSSSSLEFRVNDGTANQRTLIKLDSSSKNVGIDNLAPAAKLDVTGNGIFSDTLQVKSTIDADLITPVTSGSTDLGSLLVSGGITVKKNLRAGQNVAVDGYLTLNASDISAIRPAVTADAGAGTGLDIGSTNKKFRKIYANYFVGTLDGTLNGNITGNAGTADALSNAVTFKMAGVVSDTTGFTFNGTGTTKTFNTSISQGIITDQELTSSTTDGDLLLIYRGGVDQKLYKTTKSSIVSDLATIPIGTILPFAGMSNKIPNNYLLCDGSEIPKGTYDDLYKVIGYTYGDTAQLNGTDTFRLPDLRGRIPLGRNTMDNSGNETAATGTTYVSDTKAGVLGRSGGTDSVKIAQDNIPVTDGGTTGAAAYVATTSGTKTVNTIYVVNPYQVINYIIYAGKNINAI